MTAITDSIIVHDILTGGTADSAQILRVAANFKAHAGTAFIEAIPGSPTDEELAANFLLQIRLWCRDNINVNNARSLERIALEPALQTSVNTAGTDAYNDM